MMQTHRWRKVSEAKQKELEYKQNNQDKGKKIVFTVSTEEHTFLKQLSKKRKIS
jgi:hypothetical protein